MNNIVNNDNSFSIRLSNFQTVLAICEISSSLVPYHKPRPALYLFERKN